MADMILHRGSRKIACGFVNELAAGAPAAFGVCLYHPPRPASAGWAVQFLDINRQKWNQCQRTHDPWAVIYDPVRHHNDPIRSTCSPWQALRGEVRAREGSMPWGVRVQP